MRKQNIFDFLEEHQADIKKRKPDTAFDPTIQKTRTVYSGNYLTVHVDMYRGIAVMRYPPHPMEQFLHEEGEELPRNEYVLLARDFPWRNKIPCYSRDAKGKSIIVDWIDGEDPIPGPSLQRFLDSGEKQYIPKYKTRSADETDEDVKKLLTHGKYHFGSNANI